MKKVKLFLALFLSFLAVLVLVDYLILNKIEAKATSDITNSSFNHNFWGNKTDYELFTSSNNIYSEILEPSGFNGAILVSRGGRIIFEKYAGLSELTKGIPIDSSTAFHLASVSKTFTAMAILKLRDMALVNIDEPAWKYLPEFPFKSISIRHLLNHRSGLPNYLNFVEKLGWDKNKVLTNKNLLHLINRNSRKLTVGQPDKLFEYCNTNYALLALIVEQVSNLSYAEFLKVHFFHPLGMNNSFVFEPGMEKKVLPSYKSNNKVEPYMFLDEIYGDKNVYSSVRDLKKWDEALYENKLFSGATLEEAFRGYSYEKKGIRNYGLGWRMIERPNTKKIIYHNGWWHGNNTVFTRFPEDSTAIIVLGNKYNIKIYQARKIAGVLKGYDIQWDEEN
jgi:CubicO group peptidase (beta-lactamase class C family)